MSYLDALTQITELKAENERLREQMEREVAWRDHALMLANRALDRVPALYARTRALEAALERIGTEDLTRENSYLIARAALPEPTPPVCSNPAHWDEPHPCPMCRATPPAGGQG